MTFVQKGTENKEKMITNNRDKDKDKVRVKDKEVVLTSAMVGREPRTSRDVR